MKYLKVEWVHSSPDYPTMLYSELDDERWERRRIDVYPDGRWGFADADEEVGGTGLGETPTPPLDEIATNPEFKPVEITHEEFERLWAARRGASIWTQWPRAEREEKP